MKNTDAAVINSILAGDVNAFGLGVNESTLRKRFHDAKMLLQRRIVDRYISDLRRPCSGQNYIELTDRYFGSGFGVQCRT